MNNKLGYDLFKHAEDVVARIAAERASWPRVFSVHTCEICGGNELNRKGECIECGPVLGPGMKP